MIAIPSNSPLQAQVQSVYMNDQDTINEVFWYDDEFVVPSYTYIVTRWIPELSLHKVVSYGKLSGFLREDGKYNYRFNFDRYIRIPKIDFSNIVKVNDYYSYIEGINSSRVALLINPGDILTINGSLITQKSNGEYYLNSGIDPDDIVANRFEYFFKDRVTYDSNFYVPELIPNTIFPITVFAEQLDVTLYFAISGVTTHTLKVTPGYDFRVGLLSIPSNVRRMELYYNSALPTLYPVDKCVNEYFYFNTDGYFDVLRTTGVKKEIENSEKENIKMGNNLIVLKTNTTKQILQNTGFFVQSNKLYDIMKAPLIYVLNPTNIVAKEYTLDNTQFDGYNRVKLSERNVELTFTDPKSYKRITQKQITFFD